MMKPSATSQSVLLVDDSAFFRNMLAPVLKAAGYRVRVAPNAQGEWLEADGLGGFASGTSTGIRTRRPALVNNGCAIKARITG